MKTKYKKNVFTFYLSKQTETYENWNMYSTKYYQIKECWRIRNWKKKKNCCAITIKGSYTRESYIYIIKTYTIQEDKQNIYLIIVHFWGFY